VFERSRSQTLATEGHWERRFNYCKFFQITARNSNKSILLRYNNSDRHKSSLAKQQYIIASTFCDLQMPRYGRKIHQLLCLPGILFKFVFFGESIWVFQKISLAALNLACIHQPLGSILGVFFCTCRKWFTYLFNSQVDQLQL